MSATRYLARRRQRDARQRARRRVKPRSTITRRR
jgi:hypothetical protein